MDLLDYVTTQLVRTKGKRFESYVVHRIIDRLDDLEIKFVTQQYVSLGAGKYGLTDLYFPQFGIHVEVDEPYHLKQREIDGVRDRDIVSRSGGQVKRVKIIDEGNTANAQSNDQKTCSGIKALNQRVEEIVSEIKEAREKAENFVPWDPEKEYSPETYIKLGEIDSRKDVVLRKSCDACNCFGHKYRGWQRAMAEHLYEDDTFLWFPKLYKTKNWNNQIDDAETTITEEFIGTTKTGNFDTDREDSWLSEKRDQKRIVFAHKRDNLGQVMYRFMGVFKYDEDASKRKEGFAIWTRISTVAKTYPQKGE